MPLELEQDKNTLRKLQEALRHFGHYVPVPSDDTHLYAYGDENTNGVLHELAYEGGALSVGDLRDILSILEAI